MRYFRFPVMFGDGKKGYARQVYAIYVGDEIEEAHPTGITITATREDRREPFTVVITYDGEEYLTAEAAIMAFEMKGNQDG